MTTTRHPFPVWQRYLQSYASLKYAWGKKIAILRSYFIIDIQFGGRRVMEEGEYEYSPTTSFYSSHG